MVEKHHAVCVPFPGQGHINPMLKLAKLLHYKGFHITFVNTEFNHKRLLQSRGADTLNSLPSFQFKTIPDAVRSSHIDATQFIPNLCQFTSAHCIGPFKDILAKLNDTPSSKVPAVSCIVSDGIMSFTLEAAQELGIPAILFWTTSACGFLGYMQYPKLIEKGLIPLKDPSYLTNGYLEQSLDWIWGMKDIRLRDLPSFLRTTNPDDYMIKFTLQEIERAKKASAIVLNTFDELEYDVINALSSILPPIHAIGPLHLFQEQVDNESLAVFGSHLWEEDPECLHWLDSKDNNSVVYVNFGSVAVMTPDQLVEFAWGLANSSQSFLWIIRPDLVSGDSGILPPEFLDETKERGFLSSWCNQEQVLRHPSVGGFITHSGWNSTLESISYGVPMICCPFFGDQQTNGWYCCTKWGIGMEINNNATRDEVESAVKELMVGENGKAMKKKALEWKIKAEESAKTSGSTSCYNLEKMIQLLRSK